MTMQLDHAECKEACFQQTAQGIEQLCHSSKLVTLNYSYVDEFVKWRPDYSIVRRNVDDVRLSVDVLTSLRQEPHSDLEHKTKHCSVIELEK